VIEWLSDQKAYHYRADIYAQAYSKNPEFFSFYRSLNAYQNTFGSASDIMVVEPDSDFFDYFKNNKGRE